MRIISHAKQPQPVNCRISLALCSLYLGSSSARDQGPGWSPPGHRAGAASGSFSPPSCLWRFSPISDLLIFMALGEARGRKLLI